LSLSLIQGKKSAAEYNMSEEENKASYLGLFKVYAYCCMRCNHIWLPRFSSGYNPFDYNKLVLDSEPPKSCAKCKSKSWLKIT
jgi:rubrerythrin